MSIFSMVLGQLPPRKIAPQSLPYQGLNFPRGQLPRHHIQCSFVKSFLYSVIL